MALELARAYVQIVPSMQGVQGEISKSFGVGSPMDKQAAAAGKRSGGLLGKGLGAALLVGAGPLAGIAVAGVAVAKLTGYIGDSVRAVANWQALNAQSASAVKATGGAANVTAQQVNALAQSLEGQTSTQAETIQQGANLLLTFRNVRNEAGKGNDVFNQTTAAAVDMSRALGTDVASSAMQLGKALNDPTTGMTRLTRSGVTFTEEQKNQVKALQASGDTIGAQKVILAELNKEFGGSGAAYRATFSGQMYQLQDAVGDFGEEIASAAMPALTALVGTASKVVGWAGSLKLGSKAASGIGTVMSAIGPPIQAVFEQAGPAIVAFGKSFAPIGAALTASLAPLLPTFASLAGQVVTLVTTFSPLGLLFKSLLPVLPQLIGPLVSLAGALGGTLSAVLAAVLPLVVQLAGTLTGVLTQVISALVPVIVTLAGSFAGILASTISTLLPVIVNLVTTLGPVLTGIIGALLPVIMQLVGVVASLIPVFVPIIAQVVKLAASVIAQLIPALLPLVQAVLPLVASLLKALIPVVLPVIKILGTTLANVIKALLPVVASVIGAIVPIIKSLVKIITGVVEVISGVLSGDWSKVWSGVGKIVGGAIDLVVNVLKGAVSIVGTAIGAIVKVIGSTLKGAVDIVLSIGGNIVQGLIDGIKGGFSLVVNAAKALANLLPDWVRKVLGIHSPSRVFASIGRFVGQGLVKGLAGSQDQVKTAATSLVNQVTDAFTKLADQREAAQKKLAKLDKQLAATNTGTKSGKTAAAKLRGQIADQRKVVLDLARASDITPKQRKSLIATLKSDTRQLTSLAGTRDRLAEQLKTAQDDLASAVKIRDDFRDSIQQTSVGLGNVVDAYKAATDAGESGAPRILTTLQDAITQTRTFQTLLGQLRSFGVDDTTYAQILEKGVAGGGIGAAQELVQGGPALVQQVAGLQGQLATAGAALGTQASTVLYQAGVDAAQASVEGIKSKIVDNQAAIALLQTAMAQSVKTLGISTSALTKNAGAQIVAGLTDGIKGKGSDLDKVIAELGTKAVKKLKKVLGIKSPSRVVRREVGQQVGAGFVLGIQDMHAAAEEAAAGLASVPASTFGFDGGLGTAPAPITQVFAGPMGYTRDEVADGIATKARRALAGVNIPKVSVR